MLKRAGRYEIVAELGHGGFGQVYRAFDPQLDSMVAVKTLSVDNDAAILTRFRNEAAASRRLRHPNIVTIYDFGEQDGTPYIVMELLEGLDLKRVIDSRKALPLWRKIQIMTQVASGLAHAHANGIVHRDVKPANVMLLPDGNIKIMDFGIALISHDTQNRVTPKGAVIGTFRYLAPEQFRGLPQDARGDIFAYGLMFYELLSGVHPFHSQEDAAVMFNILSLEPVPISEVCPGCPEQLQPLLTRLLQKDPEFRYQNLEDVLFDCEPILLALKRAQAHDLFEEAKVAFENRQLEGTQTLLRRAMEFDPTYPGAREFRERLQTAMRRLAVRPRTEALANEGRELLAAGNPAEAVQKYEAAVRLDPTDLNLKSSLDQAKAAFEQSRQMARLVAEAERALSAGDLTNAHRIAQQTADLAPADARAQALVAKTQAALAEQERQAQLAEDLARVRRLIEIRSWDEASPLLDRLERELGHPDEIRVLRETLDDGRLADERQRKLASGLAGARQEIQAGSLEAAQNRLAELRKEFPESADVEQLFLYATSEIEARKHSDLVDRALRAARALVDRNRFADASRVLQSALLSYPTDTVLQRELRSVLTAQRQAERDAALSQCLDSAKASQKQGRFEEALAPLESFSSEYGSQAEVEELRQAIERDRDAARHAAELREMVHRVNDLLSHENAEEATQILQGLPSAIKGHPQITQLRTLAQAQLDRKLERAAALEDALAAANVFRQQAEFDEAGRILAEFAARYGADKKVDELQGSILADREESQRRAEELRRLVSRADDFLAEGKALEATRLLASPPSYFKDHPDIHRRRAEAETQVRQQAEREAALQAAVSSAESFRKQGRFEDALAPLEAFVRRYGPDGRVAATEQAILNNREEARLASEILDLGRRARKLLDQDNPQAAATLLQHAPSPVKESPDVRELLKTAETRWAAQQKRQAVQTILAEARAYSSREESQQALDAIERGLKRFPFDPELESARSEVLAVQTARQREEYCAQAIADIESLIVKHEYGRASSVLAEAMSKLSSDPRLLPLGPRIEAHRRDWEALQTELKIQDELARARDLLAAKPADAVALIERLTAEYPGRAELAGPLTEARETLRRVEETVLIRQAEHLCGQKQFAEAAAVLAQAGHDSPELQAARQNVETRRAAAETEQIARAIEAARKTARQDPSSALRALDKLQRQFPQRPEIVEAIEECRAEVRSRERQALIAEIQSLRTKGKFSKARALHQKAVAQFGEDAGLAQVLADIEESAAVKETAARELAAPPPPAQPLAAQTAAQPPRRARLWVTSSLLAMAILGAGVWVFTHRTPSQPSLPKPVPLTVEIRTDPAGASVQVGDRSCVTPNCRLDLPPGRYTVQAHMNGYTPAQQTLVIDATTPSGSLITLQPLPQPPPNPQSETGILVVQAGLPDVLVSVDDQAAGRTDGAGALTLVLEAKAHRVRVSKNGYQATPPERQVTISRNPSRPVVFSLTPQDATLEVRGAPEGWDISAAGKLVGRTDGTPFSKPVKPGDQILRVSQGTVSRETPQRFEPGGIVTLEWASIAPPKVTPPPPPPDPAERDWPLVSAATDPAQVRAYLDKYPNSPHAPEARTKLEALTWSRVNTNDLTSLRAYLTGFPTGPHARDAQARIDELIWNNVDKSNSDAVRAYIAQNGDSPYKAQAQAIVDQFEKQKLDADARLKQDRAKQEEDKKRLDTERGRVLAVVDRLNAAFAQHKPGDLKTIWQNPTDAYRRALDSATHTVLKLACQAPNITGDLATVVCTQTTQGPQPRPPQQVNVSLQKSGNDWMVQSVLASR